MGVPTATPRREELSKPDARVIARLKQLDQELTAKSQSRNWVDLTIGDFEGLPPSPTSSQAGMTGLTINWPGPPRRPLEWSDVRFYWPHLSLKVTLSDGTVEETAGFNCYFTFDVELLRANEVSRFSVWIQAGNNQPHRDNDQPGVWCYNRMEGVDPVPYSPEYSYGAFWLGATKKGEIKGNEGRAGDEHKGTQYARLTLTTWQLDTSDKSYHLRYWAPGSLGGPLVQAPGGPWLEVPVQ